MNKHLENRNVLREDGTPNYIPNECVQCDHPLIPFERDRHDRFFCTKCGVVYRDWPPKTPQPFRGAKDQ